MSLAITFYEMREDPRCIIKTCRDTGAGANRMAYGNMNLKNGNNLTDPVIEFRVTTAGSRIPDRSCYVKIEGEDKTRYYFITEVEIRPTGVYLYHCHIDVLMTYASQIKALTCTLDRSETIYNGYLPDSDYTALGYRSIMCKAFDKGLTTNSFILMTTG